MEYDGFWPRVGASLIDTVLILVILLPIIHTVYGPAYGQVSLSSKDLSTF